MSEEEDVLLRALRELPKPSRGLPRLSVTNAWMGGLCSILTVRFAFSMLTASTEG